MAVELARCLGLSPTERDLLADAALLHHHPPELLSRQTVDGAIALILRQCRLDASKRDPSSRSRDKLLSLLTSFHSLSLSRRGDTLASLLSAANFLVERLEPSIGEEDHREEVFTALRRKTGEGLISAVAFRACTSLSRLRAEDLSHAVSKLPVFPAIALRVLAVAASEDVSFGELSSLVANDQVLAGNLISAANSSLYTANGRISSIAHAISYLGLEESRRVITAASVRPLFASSGIAELWRHSLEVARWCEDRAASAKTRKDEAFLTGLVHDVGRLLLLKYSGETSLTFVRLVEQACDPWFAELLLFGCDHAKIGAEVLRVWKFPDRLVDAIRHHHRPERSESLLPMLVFLAEQRYPAESADNPAINLERAAQKLGIPMEAVQSEEAEIGNLRFMCA